MEQRYVEFIQDLLISIHENLHELEERKNFADPSEFDYIEAKIVAYREMLAMLKQGADQFNLPKEEIGL